MAGGIAGRGEILAVAEEAHRNVDQKAAKDLADKLKTGSRFDLNDFRAQLSQMKKMGGLSSLMDKLPAQFQQAAAGADMNVAEKQRGRREGISNSMTLLAPAKPGLFKAQRKRRIAACAGVRVQ